MPRLKHSLIFYLLAAAPAAGLFAYRLFQFWGFTVDDAYITLRYARNLAEGYGFVYNPGGPRVEGYSNPLLLIYQTAVMLLGGDGLLWTKIAGASAGFASLAGSLAIAWELISAARVPEKALLMARCLAFGGVFLLAGSPALATGCVSGLETSQFTALVTWGMWGFLRLIGQDKEESESQAPRAGSCDMASGARNHRTLWIFAGVCMGAASWSRPEGIAWAAGAGALAVLIRTWRRRPVREVLFASAIALGFWLALLGFRLAMFGYPSPNTYYAKMGGPALPRIASGLKYAGEWIKWDLSGLFGLSAAMAGIFLTPPGRRVLAAAAFLAVLGHLGMAAWEGGDWIPSHRLIAPALGVLGGIAGMCLGLWGSRSYTAPLDPRFSKSWESCIASLSRQTGNKAAAGRLAAMILAACVVIGCIGIHWESRKGLRQSFLEVQTRVYGWNDAHRPLGVWLGEWQRLRQRPLHVAIDDIGLVGWFSRAEIMDLAGLADPVWAHINYDSGRTARYPSRRLIREARPEAIVLIATASSSKGTLRTYWKTSREIFEDPDFARLYRQKTVFTHKDFPNDGYYLHVFLRRDVFEEAPPVTPPIPRTR